MATTRLGGVFMNDTDGNIAKGAAVSTENVCGLIFDTKGFSNPLGSGTAATTFANGNVVELNTSKDIAAAGIDENVMCGLPYYHLKMFFELAGENQRIFVSFMDSQTDANFDAIQVMQAAADGVIYQIGVWTAEPVATKNGENFTFTTLYTKLQTAAEALGGKIGVPNLDGNSPINIILNAPVVTDLVVDYTKLPEISSLNLPKVTHILGQEANETEVRPIQLALINALGDTKAVQVGNVGAALAVLAVAPADVSIAYVRDYNLSGAMQSCELGFGSIILDGETAGEKTFAAACSFNNMKSITYQKRNEKLHQKGYVFLTPVEGIQNGVFFSSDMTMSDGDYRSISRCRVMHKSRRVVRQALLNKINAPVMLDATTGQMSSADITEYQNTVLSALDLNMVQPGTGNAQISGRSCSIDPEQNIIANDELLIEYSLVPIGCTSVITVTEGFVGAVSE